MKKSVQATLFTAAALGAAAILSAPALAEDEKVTVAAPSGTYVNDPGHTSLHWKIGHIGLSTYTARMGEIALALEFDADDFEKSSIQATIGAGSVDTGFPGDKDFDAEIAGDLILKSADHPTIEFVSTDIEQTGPSTATVTGNLTLAGVTKPVTLAAVYQGSLAAHPFANAPAIGFSATGEFDRTDFGVEFLSGSGVADTVSIEVQAEIIKQ